MSVTPETFGPYALLSELGRGGQGTVWLAEDRKLKRKVALKLLQGVGVLTDDRLRRFRREAEAASRLDHPNICGLLDAGEVDGVPYLAFRHVEGATLAARIARAWERRQGVADTGDPANGTDPDPSSKQGIGRIVTLFEKIARALHRAHEQGLIHRDIKPGNLMVTPDGEPVVLDFGLARDELADEQTLTHSGDLLGTPAYMSPEQLLAQRVPLDRRTDVYSLGASIYECLTLQQPFAAATRAELYQRILHSDPSSVSSHNRQIPRDLQVVVETAIEKDRNRRYQTALDLAEDLRRVREFEPIRARPIGRLLRLRRWAQRHPALAVASLSVVLGLATAIGFLRQLRTELRIRGALMASIDALGSRPTEALQLALEAIELDERPETRSQLQNALAMQFRSAEVQAHAADINSIAWSERRQLLVTTADDGARLWTRDGRPFHALIAEPVFAASFSPADDRILTVGSAGVRIWTWNGQPARGPFVPPGSTVTSAVWRDRATVVTAHVDGSVSLWSADSGLRLQHRDGHHAGLFRVAACTEDGRILTHGSDGAVRIWDPTHDGVVAFPLGEAVTVLALDPRGELLLAGGARGTAALLTVTGAPIATLRGHRDAVLVATFSADGQRILTAGEDVARLWTRSGEPLGVVARHSAQVLGALFVADESRVLTWSGDGSIALWSDTGKLLLRVGSDSALSCAVACGESTLASCSWKGQLLLWELDGRERTCLYRHEDRVWDMAFDPMGRLATVSMDGSICLWSAERRLLRKLDAGAPVLSVCFSPGGDRLLAGTRVGTLHVWDATSYALLDSRPLHQSGIWSASFSPDGSMVLTTSNDGTARVWDRHWLQPRDVWTLQQRSWSSASNPHRITSGNWSRDGKRIMMTSGSGIVRLADPAGHDVEDLHLQDSRVRKARFDPTGDRILTISVDGSAHLRDCKGRCLVTYPGDVMLNSGEFSPDGTFVITARKDGTAQLWTRDGVLVCTLREPRGQVTCARFSPDGEWIVTASSEGTVRFWPTRVERLLDAARAQLAAMGRQQR